MNATAQETTEQNLILVIGTLLLLLLIALFVTTRPLTTAAPEPIPAREVISARIASTQPALGRIYRESLSGAIVAAASDHGLEPLLLAAVVEIESTYRPGLISSAHAIGPAGIMPHWIGHTPYAASYEELREAPVNIYVGAWVLALYIKQCDGRVSCGLASYNAGPSNKSAGEGYAKRVLAAQAALGATILPGSPVGASLASNGAHSASE